MAGHDQCTSKVHEIISDNFFAHTQNYDDGLGKMVPKKLKY